MAQNFTFRYPLVDGHGNWGSTDDPKSFAAMRYTEAKLTPYAAVMLAELGQGTVDWAPNFDGTLDEPTLLPAGLPNLLLNGAAGIAVGMSTDVPPHNLNVVATALIRLLDEPKTTLRGLCKHIKGPDFPTGGEIISPKDELLAIYKSGTGTLRVRSTYELSGSDVVITGLPHQVPVPDFPTGGEIISPKDELQAIYKSGTGTLRVRSTYELSGSDVVITGLPHQVSGSKVLEQIAAQMRAKKLPMVEDLRDESDHENPTRLVLMLRSSRVDAEELMSHLFASTDLERTQRVNMNVIGLNGKPAVRGLKDLLSEWLDYRLETVKRRLRYRLERVEQRLHILDGRLVAYLKIDQVIAVIRKEDKPKPVLMKRFKLSDIQAEDILNLRLRQLAKLEEINIRGEQKDLSAERDALKKQLKSRVQLKKLVRAEILVAAEQFGDERRTAIIEREPAQALDETQLIANEPVTVILSERGWARTAKGHDIDPLTLSYKSGDAYLSAARGRSNQNVVFLDSSGRAYSLPAHLLPSARGQGEPLSGRLNPPEGAVFCGVMTGDETSRWLVASDAGYGFFVQLGQLHSRNRAGKALIRVPDQGKVLVPAPHYGEEFPGNALVAAVSSIGRLLLFPAEELPELSRGKGIKILGIPGKKYSAGEEQMVAVALVALDEQLLVFSGQRRMSLGGDDLEHYLGTRGLRGSMLPRGWRKVERLDVERESGD